MIRLSYSLYVVVVVCMFGVGCANPPATDPLSSDVAVPSSGREVSLHAPGHYLWDYYLISFDPELNQARIIPVREIATHWNVLNFLEKGPCFNCMEVTGITPTPDGTVVFDAEISHPFPGPSLTGFDVRGIAMFHGSHAFPASGLVMPDRDAGDGELVNPDGYTTLYNSSTLGSGPGGLQGYLKGHFASPAVPDATLNGYKRYLSPGAENTRNAFYAGTSLTSSFELDMPDGAFIFGYAVDASWAKAVTIPVTDPMVDFPPEANCSEPWKIDYQLDPVGPGLTDQGGEEILSINVYDWQGSASHAAPTVECPSLFDGTKTAVMIGDFGNYSSWEVTIDNPLLAPVGNYSCLIGIEDNENDPATKPWLDLTAYNVVAVDVGPNSLGWARTWGSDSFDTGSGVAVNESGTVYVSGSYMGTLDFDPGPGIEERTPLGSSDIFLSCFDQFGTFQWVRTWGGMSTEHPWGLAMDGSGNLYVVGYYKGTMDFDPGLGSDEHTSNGDSDVFICSFDSSGIFQWARTFGGIAEDVGFGVYASYVGDVFVTGYYGDTVDFNPGAGIDNHTSEGADDAFLMKLNSSGDFQWARTWGGAINDDWGFGVGVDGSGEIYTAGTFVGSVDFDPGDGNDIHSANGNSDAYVSKFDSDGNYLWVITWGAATGETVRGFGVNGAGLFCVAGSFYGTVDLDPGPGTDNHESNGNSDIFLSVFNESGNYQWGRHWGGISHDYGYAASMTEAGEPLVSGGFFESMDADPGAGIDTRSSNGDADVCMSRFDAGGNLIWARTWGGMFADDSVCIRDDSAGNVYTAGSFSGVVDFDPGGGEDIHISSGTDTYVLKMTSSGTW